MQCSWTHNKSSNESNKPLVEGNVRVEAVKQIFGCITPVNFRYFQAEVESNSTRQAT